MRANFRVFFPLCHAVFSAFLENASALEYDAPCVKCKTRPITIIIRQAAYCSECFQEVAYHKFRVNIFKTRSGSQGTERIILGLSLGSASRLLLYFSQLTRLKDKNRKNMDTFFPVHIIEDDSEDCSELDSLCTELEMELIKIPLHAVFDEQVSQVGFKSDSDSKTKDTLHEFLKSAKSPSVRLDLIKILRRKLLCYLASIYECKRIFLGDSNDRMAINVMADVCAGRGAMVPWTQLPVQPISHPDIGFARPLRDIQTLEINEYLKLIGKYIPTSPEPDKASIYGLADFFISGLAQEYSATPSIVTRTAAKVETENTPMDVSRSCDFCCGPIIEGELCHSCSELTPS